MREVYTVAHDELRLHKTHAISRFYRYRGRGRVVRFAFCCRCCCRRDTIFYSYAQRRAKYGWNAIDRGQRKERPIPILYIGTCARIIPRYRYTRYKNNMYYKSFRTGTHYVLYSRLLYTTCLYIYIYLNTRQQVL